MMQAVVISMMLSTPLTPVAMHGPITHPAPLKIMVHTYAHACSRSHECTQGEVVPCGVLLQGASSRKLHRVVALQATTPHEAEPFPCRKARTVTSSGSQALGPFLNPAIQHSHSHPTPGDNPSPTTAAQPSAPKPTSRTSLAPFVRQLSGGAGSRFAAVASEGGRPSHTSGNQSPAMQSPRTAAAAAAALDSNKAGVITDPGSNSPVTFHRLLQLATGTGTESAAVLAVAVAASEKLPECSSETRSAGHSTSGLPHPFQTASPSSLSKASSLCNASGLSKASSLSTAPSLSTVLLAGFHHPDSHQSVMQRMGLDLKSMAISKRASDLELVESPRQRDTRSLDQEEIFDMVSKSGASSGIVVDGRAIEASAQLPGKARKTVAFSRRDPELIHLFINDWSTSEATAPTTSSNSNSNNNNNNRSHLTPSAHTTSATAKSPSSSSGPQQQQQRLRDSSGCETLEGKTAHAVATALQAALNNPPPSSGTQHNPSSSATPASASRAALPPVLSTRQLLSHCSATVEESQHEDFEDWNALATSLQRFSLPSPARPAITTPSVLATLTSCAATLAAAAAIMHPSASAQTDSHPHHPNSERNSNSHAGRSSNHRSSAPSPVPAALTRLPNTPASFARRSPGDVPPTLSRSSDGSSGPHQQQPQQLGPINPRTYVRSLSSLGTTPADRPRHHRSSLSSIPNNLPPSMLGPDPRFNPTPPNDPPTHPHHHHHQLPNETQSAPPQQISTTAIPLLLPPIGSLSPGRHTYTAVPLMRSVALSKAGPRCNSPSFSLTPCPPFPLDVKFQDPRAHLLNQPQHGGDGTPTNKTSAPTHLTMLSHAEVQRFRHASPLGLDRFLPPQVSSTR
ncbi:MAG: hypothetical protein WDW38_002101 [Sanguina aurantia]